MQSWLIALLLTSLTSVALAAPKSCEELKAEIEAKIQAAGVASYTLEIVPVAEATDASMVVGSCENGSRKIIYQRHSD